MPSIDDLVSLFETLDYNKNGYLNSSDMRRFIENFRYMTSNENPNQQQGYDPGMIFSQAAANMKSEYYQVRNSTVAPRKRPENDDGIDNPMEFDYSQNEDL